MQDIFSEEKRSLHLKEIQESGFIADDLVEKDIDTQVYGVNITCAWPLPDEIRESYKDLYNRLKELEDVYAYPYSQTHITILTIFNFKKRLRKPRPNLDTDTLARITNRIRQITNQTPIQIRVHPPVLVRAASFLPISNPTQEIYDIRTQIFNMLDRDNKGYDLDIPQAIHSTILRFKKVPSDKMEFVHRFEEISRGFPLLEARIKEIYITEELKPYMREGRIVERIALYPGR